MLSHTLSTPPALPILLLSCRALECTLGSCPVEPISHSSTTGAARHWSGSFVCISTMSIVDHSPTTGVVTVIVILIAIAALGALILGCWCYLRLQRVSQSEDEESIVGDGETKEPFLLVQYSAKGPCVERKAKLTPNGPEAHG